MSLHSMARRSSGASEHAPGAAGGNLVAPGNTPQPPAHNDESGGRGERPAQGAARAAVASMSSRARAARDQLLTDDTDEDERTDVQLSEEDTNALLARYKKRGIERRGPSARWTSRPPLKPRAAAAGGVKRGGAAAAAGRRPPKANKGAAKESSFKNALNEANMAKVFSELAANDGQHMGGEGAEQGQAGNCLYEAPELIAAPAGAAVFVDRISGPTTRRQGGRNGG